MIAIPSELHNALTALINATYLDKIERINAAQLTDEKDIVVSAIDGRKQLAIKISASNISVRLQKAAEFKSGITNKKSYKVCTNGLSCRNTCISRNKICRHALSPGQAQQREKIIAAIEAEPPKIKAGFVGEISPELIAADPKRFQYKMLGELTKTGEVGSLSGVQTYDPNLAGIVQVWRDPADDGLYVVNGHNRLALAKRAGAAAVTVRVVDAPDAQHARAIGALTNIAEGRGTGLDAAKFFRDSGLDTEAIKAKGIPMREAIAQKGIAIAKLDDSLFTKLVNGDLTEERAAILGGSGLSAVKQRDLHALAEKKSRGKALSNEVLAELVDGVKAAESGQVQQFDLFGNSTVEKSTAIERATLAANVRKQILKDKKLFGLVARSKAAKELERGNNQINQEASKAIADQAEQAGKVFDQLKNQSGAISTALNNAAKRMGSGEKQAEIQKALYAEIADIVRGGKY